eukprot:2102552-Rhodomonas_salina.2
MLSPTVMHSSFWLFANKSGGRLLESWLLLSTTDLRAVAEETSVQAPGEAVVRERYNSQAFACAAQQVMRNGSSNLVAAKVYLRQQRGITHEA